MNISLTEYLDISAKQYPNKVAFVDHIRELTFSNFRDEALAIASIIIDKNIQHKPIVTILPKSIDTLVAFLGIAYSANFYTPLDDNMPLERMKKILSTLEPKIAITNKENINTAIDLGFDNSSIILIEDSKTVYIDESKIYKVTDTIIDTDLLYILFTSGSTGTPKGVTISHRSVIDYIEWVTSTFDIDNKTIFANQAPFYFDNSILDIYSTLKNGSTMCIIPKELFSFPIKLLEYIRNNKINTIFWVPSVFMLVVNMRALGMVDISSLQKVLFAGEPMHNKVLNAWRKILPNALFANLYGPTEIADVCTYYIVNREFNDAEPLPIGNDCRNTRTIVLDTFNNLVDKSDTTNIGELCICGTSLSLGYYNNKDKSDEVFIQNPLHNNYRDIIYRTGDIVRYNEYAEILYLSRKDFQIKHMGHRVELGEIETAVTSLDKIISACCLYNSEKSKIILFYQSDMSEDYIITNISKLLPDYMMPNLYKKIDMMPININGKIDRVKLKELL